MRKRMTALPTTQIAFEVFVSKETKLNGKRFRKTGENRTPLRGEFFISEWKWPGGYVMEETKGGYIGPREICVEIR